MVLQGLFLLSYKSVFDVLLILMFSMLCFHGNFEFHDLLNMQERRPNVRLTSLTYKQARFGLFWLVVEEIESPIFLNG